MVKNGDILKIEKLDAEAGKEVVFDKVLLVAKDDGTGVQIGAPYLDGVSVSVEVKEQGREKKMRVVKYKRKVRYKRVIGHRQRFTKVKVNKTK